MNKELQTERRKFFGKLGKSVLAFSLLSSFPLNLLAREKETKKLKKVSIHPNAVKRDH